MSKKTSKTETMTETKVTKAVEQTFKVAEFAKANEMDPKVVRAKLRRIYNAKDADKSALPKPIKEGSWVFAMSDAEAVQALITA
jgi:hypothetical protein